MATRYIFYRKPSFTHLPDLWAVTEFGGTDGWFTGKIDDEWFVKMEVSVFDKYQIQEIPKGVAHAVPFSQIIPYPELVESGNWRKSIYEGEVVHNYDDDGNYVDSYWKAADKTLIWSTDDNGNFTPKYEGKYTLDAEDIQNAIACMKLFKKARLKERMEKEWLLLWQSKSPLEKETWAEQARQATLYRQTENSGDAPLIYSIAEARGRTFAQQIDKVEEKIEEWNQKIVDVLGPFQRRIDYIDAATTFEEVYNFENEGASAFNGAAVIATPPSDY
jgi:hypothetical protein